MAPNWADAVMPMVGNERDRRLLRQGLNPTAWMHTKVYAPLRVRPKRLRRVREPKRKEAARHDQGR